jgi:hypothetical protein
VEAGERIDVSGQISPMRSHLCGNGKPPPCTPI